MGKSPHQVQIDELRREMAAQRRTIAGLVVEVGAVRRLLSAAGITAPEPVPEGFIKLSDYAKLICRSYDAVRSRARRRQLESVKIDGVRYVKNDRPDRSVRSA